MQPSYRSWSYCVQHLWVTIDNCMILDCRKRLPTTDKLMLDGPFGLDWICNFKLDLVVDWTISLYWVYEKIPHICTKGRKCACLYLSFLVWYCAVVDSCVHTMYSGDNLKYELLTEKLPCTCDLVLAFVFGHTASPSSTISSSGECNMKLQKMDLWTQHSWLCSGCVVSLASTEHKLA